MIEMMLLYGMHLIGTPYKWGGNNPLEGFDCSGFILELLSAGGYQLPDMTAQDLHLSLVRMGWQQGIERGAILFFGDDRYSITHTAIALNNRVMLEAGGGDHRTIKYQDAIDDNAFVRIRPIRSDIVAALQPKF